MHIGFLIYGSLDTLTGGYLYDRHVVAELRARGDDVTVVSLPYRSYRRHLLDNWSRSFRRDLENARFDALIQDEMNHPSCAWLNARLDVPYPVVSLIHLLEFTAPNPAWKQRIFRRIERRYCRTVDGFLYNSADSERLVRELVTPAEPRGVIAYPGKDHLAVPRGGADARSSGPLEVVYVGNVIRRKGLRTLVEAIASLAPGTCRLTAIGGRQFEPAYVAEVEAAIRARDLADRVRMLGAVPNVDIAEHLRAAHVFCMPSEYEGFGIVYVEALGFGLPIIASTAGAARELIEPNESGFLVAPGDATAIATHLRTLADDRARLATMSAAARTRYDALPTWAETTSTIRSFIEKSIDETRST